jgi:hypothetical protein
MPAKKPMDWNAVDWSQQNRDIVEQFQVSPAIVSLKRKQLGKPKPKLWYKRKTSRIAPKVLLPGRGWSER